MKVRASSARDEGRLMLRLRRMPQTRDSNGRRAEMEGRGGGGADTHLESASPGGIRSAASSGGPSSKASLIVSTIPRTEAASPSRISTDDTSTASGKPE